LRKVSHDTNPPVVGGESNGARKFDNLCSATYVIYLTLGEKGKGLGGSVHE